MAPMGWSVVSAVTVVMPMAVTPSVATAAATQAGQESTVITCAHKASGDPTVQSAAPARTKGPALPRTAHVSVHLDTEGPPAKEAALRVSMGIVAASHAPSVSTAPGRAIMSPATVSVCLASLARCATRFVQVAGTVGLVLRSASAPTTAHATPSMALANAFLAG